MTTDLVRVDPADVTLPDAADAKAAVDHYLVTGDVSELPGPLRLALYLEICRRWHIDSVGRPLDWIEFYDPNLKRRKLTLYPTHLASDQLAYLHKIRVKIVDERPVGTSFKVRLEGTMPDGRTEENVAYLTLLDPQGQLLTGQRYNDALMKTYTKAKRRLILGMVGFNLPAAPEALERGRRVLLDARGDVIDHPTDEQRYLAANSSAARAAGFATWETAELPPTGLEDEPSLPVRPDPGPPRRTGPRPTFRPSKEDIERWRGRWHVMAEGTSFADDDYRHRFIEQYTDGRVDRTEAFWATATARQAEELLSYVEALIAEEKAAIAAASEPAEDEERPF